mmetsp:Transcript_10393/g.30386  ORF Transcript_10393/g.30386 Transcript_10393/m.30386 type:complete len:270 (+) Transcript_10393:4569-5378(+)
MTWTAWSARTRSSAVPNDCSMDSREIVIDDDVDSSYRCCCSSCRGCCRLLLQYSVSNSSVPQVGSFCCFCCLFWCCRRRQIHEHRRCSEVHDSIRTCSNRSAPVPSAVSLPDEAISLAHRRSSSCWNATIPTPAVVVAVCGSLWSAGASIVAIEEDTTSDPFFGLDCSFETSCSGADRCRTLGHSSAALCSCLGLRVAETSCRKMDEESPADESSSSLLTTDMNGDCTGLDIDCRPVDESGSGFPRGREASVVFSSSLPPRTQISDREF